MRHELNVQQLEELIKDHEKIKIREMLASLPPIEAADLLNSIESTEQAEFLFRSLPRALSIQTFEYLDLPLQKQLLESLPNPRIAEILNEMSADDRTSLLEDLDQHTLSLTISLLNPQERSIAIRLLGYPEYSVGRLMTPDYIAVKAEWKVSESLDYIRKYGRDSETLNIIYVVDDKGRLIDDLKVREILLASPDSFVHQLMDYRFNALEVTNDQEGVIDIFKRLNRVAMPVTDSEGYLLGIVTIDDVLEVIQEEDTEDIQKLGAVEALDDPYLDTPIFILIRKRAVWLVVLFLGEMLTATAMGFFEDEIAKAVILSLFIPLIISSGGNSGSQAATLIIRAMALGEVTTSDWWRVIKRELVSGIFLGLMLGIIGFSRIAIWAQFTDIYGPHWFLIAIVVSLSLVGVVLWGTFTGSTLPLLLKRLGLDPATSSAPFVATLIDVTGLVIYFTLAVVFLRGALL